MERGGQRYGERNEGNRILETAQSLELSYVNTGFTKPGEHMLARTRERKRVANCKVIPGEAYVKQHRLQVMDIN